MLGVVMWKSKTSKCAIVWGFEQSSLILYSGGSSRPFEKCQPKVGDIVSFDVGSKPPGKRSEVLRAQNLKVVIDWVILDGAKVQDDPEILARTMFDLHQRSKYNPAYSNKN